MKIRINKIKLFGYHGIYKIEKEKGQNFTISVEIKIVDTDYKDKIENTVDYMGIVDIVKDVFSAKRYNLIETLSVDLSNKIMENSNIKSTRISIKKTSPPINMDLDSVEVEYRNKRKWFLFLV